MAEDFCSVVAHLKPRQAGQGAGQNPSAERVSEWLGLVYFS